MWRRSGCALIGGALVSLTSSSESGQLTMVSALFGAVQCGIGGAMCSQTSCGAASFNEGVKMELDPSTMSTADVKELARLSGALADIMVRRLEAAHPKERLALFFLPRGVPDTVFVSTFGDEILHEVLETAELVFRAMNTRQELEKRKYTN